MDKTLPGNLSCTQTLKSACLNLWILTVIALYVVLVVRIIMVIWTGCKKLNITATDYCESYVHYIVNMYKKIIYD